jgi:hypothetical protein
MRVTTKAPVPPEIAVAPEINTVELIEGVIRANYAAMENKQSEEVLRLYHPHSNLKATKKELDAYFAEMDVSYGIKDIRNIGDDGTNYVIIYHETTEFRIHGDPKKKVVETVDTDVLMVFRKDDDQFKIFTSRSLKPGM